MCVLRVHINKSIFGKVLLSILNKLFSKLVYYCVPLGHTSVKSIKIIFAKPTCTRKSSIQCFVLYYNF